MKSERVEQLSGKTDQSLQQRVAMAFWQSYYVESTSKQRIDWRYKLITYFKFWDAPVALL